MTPDTAEFPRDAQWTQATPWTDDENGIIEAVSTDAPQSTTLI